MDRDWRKVWLFRLDLLDRNLRCCRSGAEIHDVSNMRNSIIMLRELIERNIINEEYARNILESIERTQLHFFKRKYAALGTKH